MSRGLDGMDLFRDDEDRLFFLKLVEQYIKRADMRCYAWVLMRNHYHFVLRSSELPLSTCMKPLNSRYAGYFNRKYQRRGYVFQDRYKSVATQEQLYGEEMVRYVHLNPVRAGVCKNVAELDRYQWSGHAALIGKIAPGFQDIKTVLRRFGKTIPEAHKHYRQFLKDGLLKAEGNIIGSIRHSINSGHHRESPGLWVIGDHDFVAKALAADKENRLRIARYAAKGFNIERIAGQIARQFHLKEDAITRRGRNNAVSDARKIIAYLAHRTYDIPVIAIARFLGVGGSAVSMMISQGESLAAKKRITLID
jgi:REP element-mobilizing transposase RayT